jgi:hypothetical protein
LGLAFENKRSLVWLQPLAPYRLAIKLPDELQLFAKNLEFYTLYRKIEKGENSTYPQEFTHNIRRSDSTGHRAIEYAVTAFHPLKQLLSAGLVHPHSPGRYEIKVFYRFTEVADGFFGSEVITANMPEFLPRVDGNLFHTFSHGLDARMNKALPACFIYYGKTKDVEKNIESEHKNNLLETALAFLDNTKNKTFHTSETQCAMETIDWYLANSHKFKKPNTIKIIKDKVLSLLRHVDNSPDDFSLFYQGEARRMLIKHRRLLQLESVD